MTQQRAQVFNSYSRLDEDFAKRLVNRLAKDNRDVWVDWQDIPHAADWLQEIYAGIEGADTFIIIVTQNSLSSEICNYEIQHARKHRKRIVPVIRQRIKGDAETMVKGTWYGKDWQHIADANWQEISHLNWIFFDKDEEFDIRFAELVQTIDTDLEHVKLHTRLLIRAREWEQNSNSISFLAVGEELAAAEAWLADAKDKSPPPTALHREFVAASRKEEDALEARTRRLQFVSRAASIAMAILIIVSLGAGFITLNAIDSSNMAATDVAHAQIANATSVQLREDAESLEVAIRAREAYDSSDIYVMQSASFALRLALEASYIASPPRTQRILGELAYSPGIRRVIEVDEATLTGIALNHDGTNAVTGTEDGIITVWDMYTGEISTRFNGHSAAVRHLRFLPDTTYVLSGADDGSVILWNTATLEIIQRYEGQTQSIADLKYNADESSVVSLAANTPYPTVATVMAWDFNSGDVRIDEDFTFSEVHRVGFHPDVFAINESGSLAVFGNSAPVSGELILVDVLSGEVISNFGNSGDWTSSVVFASDDSQILTGTCHQNSRFDCTMGGISFWVIQHDRASRMVSGHHGVVNALLVSQDSSLAVSSSAPPYDEFPSTIILWDSLYVTPLGEYAGHEDRVEYLALSGDNRRLLSGTAHELIMWDIQQGDILRSTELARGEIVGLSISPDGRMLLASVNDAFDSYGDGAVLWDIYNWKQLGSFSEGLLENVNATFHPDGSIFATSSALYNLESGEIIFEHDDSGYMNELAFSPDGSYLVTGNTLGYVRILDTDKGEILREFRAPGHRTEASVVPLNGITSITFSPDGTQVLAGLEDGTAALWDVSSGILLKHFEMSAEVVNSVAFSHDGSQILLGTDSQPTLVDVASGEVIRRYVGHTGVTLSTAFSPDGKRMVSGSADNTLILWDFATGEIIHQYRTRRGVVSVVFSLDGTTIISADANGEIIQWRHDTPEQLQLWVHQNRHIANLSCVDRIGFGLSNCRGDIIPALPTPNPTQQPHPLPTIPQVTYTPITSRTPSATPTIIHSSTPTYTPAFAPSRTPPSTATP